MAEGKFREDLYFRLNVFQVKLPPLRERKEDIPALAEAFLSGFARDLGKSTLRLAPEAASLLQGYGWPGNVRELRNLMERAAVLSKSEIVDAALMRSLLPMEAGTARANPNLDSALANLERQMILEALHTSGDNKIAAAKLLGIGERTLWTKLKKHGL
jgi:DNA-binding NtrC family response regulator